VVETVVSVALVVLVAFDVIGEPKNNKVPSNCLSINFDGTVFTTNESSGSLKANPVNVIIMEKLEGTTVSMCPAATDDGRFAVVNVILSELDFIPLLQSLIDKLKESTPAFILLGM
jgi:hypothetical protein